MSRKAERLRVLDELAPPELWPDIRLREPRVLPDEPMQGHRVLAAALAFVVAIAGLGVVVFAFRGEPAPPALGPATVPSQLTFIRNGELWAIEENGTERRISLEPEGSVNGVSWSPDGDRMAVSIEVNSGTEGGQFHLYVANADGDQARRLTDGISDRLPAWSPDGSTIAFTRDLSDGEQEIFAVHAEGGEVAQLTDTDGSNLEPTWSPDGSRLAFTSTRDGNGNSEIYVMDADGSDPIRLTDDPGWDAGPAWSSDDRIAYTSDGPEPGIFLIDPTAIEPTLLLADPDPFDAFVAWSPDARSLAVTSRRDGTPRLFRFDFETRSLVHLASGDLLWGPAWRPFAQDAADGPAPLTQANPMISASIPVGPQGNTNAILYAEGSVWVAAAFVEGGGGVDRSMLFRVDASTNEIVAEIPLEGGPTFVSGGGGLAYGFGSVWVAGYAQVDGAQQAVVQRVDTASNRVVATIPVGGTYGADVALDQRGVWVAYFGEQHASVGLIDPGTDSAIADVPLPSDYVRRITVGSGGVVATELEWNGVESPCFVLTAIDPASATIGARERLGPGCAGAQLFEWNGEMWASAGGDLLRVDPVTAQLVGEPISFEPEHFPRSFVFGTGREVWFGAYPGGDGNRPDRLARLDAVSGQIEYYLQVGGIDAVFAPETRTIWILEFDGSLTRVDLYDR